MPQALAIGAIVASVAGTAASAASAQSQGNYQAMVAQRNAQIARQNENNAVSSGAEQQQQQLFQTAATVSAARAAQGSSGLDVNSGSGVNVRASDAALGNLSALEIRNNALRASIGYQDQSQAFEASAQNYQQAGENTAFGDVLSGIGSAGGLYNQFKLSGALPGATSPTISP